MVVACFARTEIVRHTVDKCSILGDDQFTRMRA